MALGIKSSLSLYLSIEIDVEQFRLGWGFISSALRIQKVKIQNRKI